MSPTQEHSTTIPHIFEKESDATLRQRRATIPEHDIWVAASAGSGKTKVLTDRVLRLLLPDNEGRWEGSPPHKILCITFTKAAAALMAIRIQKRLGQWVTDSDKDLRKDLESLIGAPPSPAIMTAARELFAKVLDVPGGMAIMTIHSFCQSILGRFPVESGLTPGFGIIDDQSAKDCLSKAITGLIDDIETRKRPDLDAIFHRTANIINFDHLKEALSNLLNDYEKIEQTIDQWGQGETLRTALIKNMGLPSSTQQNDLLYHFVTSRPETALKEAAKTLASTTKKKDIETGTAIADFLSLDNNNRQKSIDLYRQSFLTKKGDVKKLSKETIDTRPDIIALLTQEKYALDNLDDQCAILDQAQKTADILTLAFEARKNYQQAKRHLNALDFNDLITKTRHLLETRALEWVHFKLDEGIDHILVDEAQDTNHHQWKIIEKLSEELQSGAGRETKTPRSLFIVGDKKQSIFSFQGADPDIFNKMRHFFENRSHHAERQFDPVSLDTSFRTTQPILKLVDAIFSDPHLAALLGQEKGEKVVHNCYRTTSSGKVEIWQPVISDQNTHDKKSSHWLLPFSKSQASSTTDNNQNLATQIANRIHRILNHREKLPSTGKPAEPRDILVLVRARTGSFIADLTRQLKLLNIPVSGIDRMQLREQIAIEDCLALARFVRLPQDNLSLACVLKSPFIRLTEDQLMELALHRHKDKTLWDMAQEKLDKKICNWLSSKIDLATKHSPFTFFNETLSCACPYDLTGSARRAFANILGPDCLDPLDEFLTYCLKCEEKGLYGLEDFISHMEKSSIEIKRDREDSEKESGNQVQIMTVHASKGMEAPIVFLPDTVSKSSSSKLEKLLWIDAPDEKDSFPLWTNTTSISCKQYADKREEQKNKDYAEYIRLLYVALTRAKDHLYIAADLKKQKNIPEGSWYHLIKTAMDNMGNTQQEEGRITLSFSGTDSGQTLSALQLKDKTPLMPQWLRQTPPKESDPKHFIQPSLLGRQEDPALSPLQNTDNHRFERGLLTHRLFQFLPDIAPQYRTHSAKQFLDKSGKSLPLSIREEIYNEVMNILNDPVFSEVFGQNSLAEISVTGDIGNGRILSGQIDRLVITKEKILIVDFKSNRPSPDDPAHIPQNYRDQLLAYKSAISKAYPNIPIHCALLWTDKALLMPIST